MAIRKIGESKYYVDVTIGRKADGGQARRTKTCSSQAEAEYYEREFKIEKALRHGVVLDTITLSEFVKDIYWEKKIQLRENTKSVYARVLRKDVLPQLGEKAIKDIRPKDVQELINACATEKVAKNAREALSSVMNLAVLLDYVKANPASARFTYPPKNMSANRRGEIMPHYSQHRKLLDHVARYYPGELTERTVVLGLCFGLRPEEVSGLDWENVDLKRGYLYIDQVYSDDPYNHLDAPKTTKGYRSIPISDYAASRFKQWSKVGGTYDLQGRPATPVAFNQNGGRASRKTINNAIRVLRADSYSDGTPIPKITQWSLRHSFATAGIVEAHIDTNIMSEILGHEDETTTRNLYVKPGYENLISGIAAINSCYGF